MEFDSGGNDVRIRTGKTLGLGKAPLIGVRRDSNVSSDKNQNQNSLKEVNFLFLKSIKTQRVQYMSTIFVLELLGKGIFFYYGCISPKIVMQMNKSMRNLHS